MGSRLGPELTYPGDATLDDLTLHVGLTSETVSSENEVLCRRVRGPNVSQLDFLVAKREDAVQMMLVHLSAFPQGVHPRPLQVTHPLQPNE